MKTLVAQFSMTNTFVKLPKSFSPIHVSESIQNLKISSALDVPLWKVNMSKEIHYICVKILQKPFGMLQPVKNYPNPQNVLITVGLRYLRKGLIWGFLMASSSPLRQDGIQLRLSKKSVSHITISEMWKLWMENRTLVFLRQDI